VALDRQANALDREAGLTGSPTNGPNWAYVRARTSLILMVAACVMGTLRISPFFLLPDTGNLWIDAHIYYRATEAWLAGANPWAAGWGGIPFAGPPPALLLNLPFQPFGEPVAVLFWAVTNTLSVMYLIRRFRLPFWFLLFLPISEAWLAASPDLTLAAGVLVGMGWLAALTKPYAVPALLAAGRWRGIALAIVLGIATIPLLPWTEFIHSRAAVEDAFARYTVIVSAFGAPILMLVTLTALVSLGARRGLGLTTPGLLAQQPHYSLFSLEYIGTSPILVIALALPVEHLASIGVIGYAVWIHRASVRMLVRRNRGEFEAPQPATEA
jgi:hypothetical protein